MVKYITLITGFYLLAGVAAGNVVVDSYFDKDSVKLGEPVHYILKATYPTDQQIIYPDSSADFSPFEFSNKTYGRTTCTDSTCTDSAVYTLKAFDLDKTQQLSLPVYAIHGRDSTLYYSDTAAVHLQFVIKELPDSLSFRYSTELAHMEKVTNYQHAIAWVVAGLFLTAMLIIVLYKPLRTLISKSRDEKRYKKFQRTIEPLIAQANTAEEIDKFAQAWKDFMGYVAKQPISSMTTREIHRLYKDEALKKMLQQVDGMMYKPSGSIDRSTLQSLYEYAVNHFQKHKKSKHE